MVDDLTKNAEALDYKIKHSDLDGIDINNICLCFGLLVKQLAAKDAEIASWIADRDRWIARYEGLQACLKAKDARIHELEQLAIEQHIISRFAGNREWGISLWKEYQSVPEYKKECEQYRLQAAKELAIQASQLASYLDRLEAAFLDSKKSELYFREYSKRGDVTLPDAYERSTREAQEALDKLRSGN